MINVHASLLPKYRGAAPVHRAVIDGETETGVTIMRVVKALDAGPMLRALSRPIGLDESSDVVERDLADARRRPARQCRSTISRPDALRRCRRMTRRPPTRRADQGRRADRLQPAGARSAQPRARPAAVAGRVHVSRRRRLVIHQARLSAADAGDASQAPCVSADGTAITVACGDGRAVRSARGAARRPARDVRARFLAGHGG